jgi:hypothetical protein
MNTALCPRVFLVMRHPSRDWKKNQEMPKITQRLAEEPQITSRGRSANRRWSWRRNTLRALGKVKTNWRWGRVRSNCSSKYSSSRRVCFCSQEEERR